MFLLCSNSLTLRKREGGKKEKHAEKKGGEKRAERQRGGGSVPKREGKRAEKKGRDMPKKGEGIVRCGNRR